MAKQLKRDELHYLFEALDIDYREIEKAQYEADTNDVNLQAKNVLRKWKQKIGKKATRNAILEALKECKFTSAIEELQKTWAITAKGDSPVSVKFQDFFFFFANFQLNFFHFETFYFIV